MIRLALIGYGRAGRTFHAPLIRATPGLEIAVVASSRPETVRADLPQVRIVPSAEDVWADASVDVAVIATPTATHVALAAAAIEAGKHVVVDKPLADSLEGARRLGALASRTGRLLTTFQNRRWDGDFMALESIVRDGILGEATHVESHFDRYRPAVRDRWRERPGPGSGVWNDLGPHLADQALRLFGLPDWVNGSLAAHRTSGLVDDWAHVILGYPRRVVILHASMLAAAPAPRFVAHGSRASWIKYGVDAQEARLAAEMGLDAGPPPHERAILVDGATGIETDTVVPPGDYRRFYAALRDAVHGDGDNPVPPAQAIATTAVVESAARSAKERRAVALALTDEERAAAAPAALES